MRQSGPRADKDQMGGEGGPRFKSKRRRKVSYLTLNKIETVDYKEINILRRFLTLLPQLLAISFVTFLLIRLLPGNPAYRLLGPLATDSAVAELSHKSPHSFVPTA